MHGGYSLTPGPHRGAGNMSTPSPSEKGSLVPISRTVAEKMAILIKPSVTAQDLNL